jgi:hypothetical protein
MSLTVEIRPTRWIRGNGYPAPRTDAPQEPERRLRVVGRYRVTFGEEHLDDRGFTNRQALQDASVVATHARGETLVLNTGRARYVCPDLLKLCVEAIEFGILIIEGDNREVVEECLSYLAEVAG